MKYFFKRLFIVSWIPDEYFELKKKYDKDFEIDGYTYCGKIIRNIRIKFFNDYFDEKITDSFEFIGKIEMKERIKKILKKLLERNNQPIINKERINYMKINTFWGVYNKKGKIISISKSKITAQEEALRKSKYRWTFQTMKRDFEYLIEDGYTITKSRIAPLDN